MKVLDTNAFDNLDSTNNKEVDDNDSILNDLDFIRLLLVARTYWYVVVLLVTFGLGAAYVYNRYSQPIYESFSVIKLDVKENANSLGIQSSATEIGPNLSGEIELIQSKLIHEQALNLLNLNISYYSEGNINAKELYNSSPFRVSYEVKNQSVFDQKIKLKVKNSKEFVISFKIGDNEFEEIYNFGQAIENNFFKIVVFKNKYSNLNEGNFSFKINSPDALYNFISSNLVVQIINPSAYTLSISFKDHNGEKAKDIIKAVDSVYLVESLKRKYQAQEQTIKFLNDQLDVTERNLSEYETKLENFTRINKTTNIGGEVAKVLAHGETLKEELAKAKIQMSVLDQLKGLMLNNENIKQHLPTLSALPDPQITNGIVTLNKLQQDKEKLLATSKSTTFAAKNKAIEIENVKNALLELILQNKKLLYGNIVEFNNKIIEEENTFYKLPSKETELTKLKRFYGLYEKFYLMLIDRKAEYGMTKAGAVPEFIVLSQPMISKLPISPKKLTAYLFGGGGALLLGIFFIFFKYMGHNTISNVGELEKSTIAPVLGFVPVFDKNMDVSRLVVDKNPKSPVIEALRSIRTNLEFLSSDKSRKLISVTSTISGEGKTFVAINLGGVIAFSGTKVCIIDMDMRKPKIHVGFGVDNDKGMSTVLIGKHRVEDCIHRSTIDTLDFITSGPTPPNPSELILKPEFDETMNYLKSRYDLIIIDTPPVGLVTDGILVMRKVDFPIYVVRADYSKKGFEKNINKLVRQHGFKNLSVILNAFNNMLGSYGYGYQYGYGYGYGYYSEQEKEEESFFSKVIDFFKKSK
jgi:capsular exopolysaccharide synthesis family protein